MEMSRISQALFNMAKWIQDAQNNPDDINQIQIHDLDADIIREAAYLLMHTNAGEVLK